MATNDGRDTQGRFIKGVSGNPTGLHRARIHSEPDPDLDAIEARTPRLDATAAADGRDLEHFDGWLSAMTGFGTHSHDKRESHVFVPRVISYHEAIDIWRADDIAARAIGTLPEDCFRQGYELAIKDPGSFDDLKEDVEDLLAELKADETIERAYKYERAYGGAAILMGLDDGAGIDEPVDLTRVKGINWLTLLEPIEIYPESYYQDVNSKKYGEPEYYRLQSFTVAGAGTVIGVTDRRAPPPTTQLIHESRLIVFGGIRVSRYQRSTGMMGPLWGDSMLVRLLDTLRDFHIAWSSAGLVATDFAQTVITIEGLRQLVAKQPQKLADRMKALELSRSTARAVLLDKDETLKRESTTLTGLPELLDRLSMRCAAAVDLPLSLLMGQTPPSLGNDASQDVRWYYDRVASVQRRYIAPKLRFIASVAMQSIRKRKLPKKWNIRFRPLWQLSEKELAEAHLTQARTDSMYVKMGATTSNEVRKSRFKDEYSYGWTGVDEKKEAPGFIAPLPAGVVPKADPAEGVIKSVEASQEQQAEGAAAPGAGAKAAAAGKPVGPSAHLVGGYARRNPRGPALGAAAKEGGDTEPKNRDHADADGPGQRRAYAGLQVVVETPKGADREWTDLDGSVGRTRMLYDYGYVPGANGADGDSVDVYLGPSEQADNAYVVHQNQPPDYVLYDEDKVMLGFDSLNHARDAYLAHRTDGERAIGGMTVLPMPQFVELFGLGHQDVGAPNHHGSPAEVHPASLPGAVEPSQEKLDRIEERDGRWFVFNEAGTKPLSHGYETKGEAVQRLRAVEYFKAHPDQLDGVDPESPEAEKIIGGWSEQETGYEVDKPASPEPAAPVAVPAALHAAEEDD